MARKSSSGYRAFFDGMIVFHDLINGRTNKALNKLHKLSLLIENQIANNPDDSILYNFLEGLLGLDYIANNIEEYTPGNTSANRRSDQENPHDAPLFPQNIQRTALVIGNSNYKQSALKTPVNDAKDVSSQLDALGFNTTSLINSNHYEIENAIRRYGLSLSKEGGAGFFTFQGMEFNTKEKTILFQ